MNIFAFNTLTTILVLISVTACQADDSIADATEIAHLTYTVSTTDAQGKTLSSTLNIWLTDKPDFFVERHMRDAGIIQVFYYDGKHLHMATHNEKNETTHVGEKLTIANIANKAEAHFVAFFTSTTIPFLFESTINPKLYSHHQTVKEKLKFQLTSDTADEKRYAWNGATFNITKKDGLLRVLSHQDKSGMRTQISFFMVNDVTGYNRDIVRRWAKKYFFFKHDDKNFDHIGESKEDILKPLAAQFFPK